MPGQPGPVYPPGQFSDWNRPSVRASWLGANGHGDGSGEGAAEPAYSVLATSDPSADATATQTWAVIDDTGGWSPPPLARDVSAHTDGEGFPGIRRAGGRGADVPRVAFGAAGTVAEPGGRQLAPRESGSLPASSSPASSSSASGPASGDPGRPVRLARQAHRARSGSFPGPASPAGQPGPPGTARPPGRQAPASPTAGGGQTASWDSGSLPATGRASARHGQGAARTSGEIRRRGGEQKKRSHRTLIGLLMAPVVVVILVVAVIVYLGSRPVPTASNAAAPATKPAVAPTRPAPVPGPWKDITSQAVDTQPLSSQELYPARFAEGGSAGIRTVDRANTKCTKEVIGSALRTAVRKGGCTQVIRASYLSTNRKMMATIGVLNLVDVAAADKVGKASGATEFIRQLPGPHGPTRNLTKGTGLEDATVKGHYLILIWTEFANLHAPTGKKQRKELAKFSLDLFAGTANVSLTSRMVTGRPRIP
jgi:hypothetical protein